MNDVEGRASEWYNPKQSDPAKACYVEVTGPRLDRMQDHALEVAAKFLGEPQIFLYIASASPAIVTERERWISHLGVERKPTRWSSKFFVKLDPAIVDERRQKRDERTDDESDQ